jgi:WD40 repeat protein
MLRLWNVATGAPLHRPLAGHSEQIQALAFSPDGSRVASAGGEGFILFWDSEQQRSRTADYKDPDYVMRLDAETGEGGVTSLAFSPDGRFLLSAGGVSHALKIWDTREGAQIGADIKGHDGPSALVAFSPTGEFFVSAGDDMKLLLWPGPKRWPDQLCKKLTRNMSRKEWREWVSPEIAYVAQCPGLPISPDAPDNIKEKP